MDISVVVPLYNEAESLPELEQWIARVMRDNGFSYEIIFVNDGSTDGSWEVIERLAEANPAVRGVCFRRNYGKSPALNVGFARSEGDVVITMDADLQDSPDEIPELYRMIREEGYDIVSGYKQKRYDPLSKTIPTKLFNATARRGVEKLGGYGLRQRVVALLLIAAHDVVAFLAYHAVEFRNLVRRILQVGVHGDNHVAFGAGEAHVQRRAFSIIASETHTAHGRVGLGQTLYHLPGTVGTAVVHEYYLIAEAVVAHHTGYPLLQFRKRFGFVVQRHYY